MKTFRWIIMVVVSICFIMSMSSVVWSFAIWEEGKVFKLKDGRQAIILQDQLYLLTPANQGKYQAATGALFNVNVRGIIGPIDLPGTGKIIGPTDIREVGTPTDTDKVPGWAQ